MSISLSGAPHGGHQLGAVPLQLMDQPRASSVLQRAGRGVERLDGRSSCRRDPVRRTRSNSTVTRPSSDPNHVRGDAAHADRRARPRSAKSSATLVDGARWAAKPSAPTKPDALHDGGMLHEAGRRQASRRRSGFDRLVASVHGHDRIGTPRARCSSTTDDHTPGQYVDRELRGPAEGDSSRERAREQESAERRHPSPGFSSVGAFTKRLRISAAHTDTPGTLPDDDLDTESRPHRHELHAARSSRHAVRSSTGGSPSSSSRSSSSSQLASVQSRGHPVQDGTYTHLRRESRRVGAGSSSALASEPGPPGPRIGRRQSPEHPRRCRQRRGPGSQRPALGLDKRAAQRARTSARSSPRHGYGRSRPHPCPSASSNGECRRVRHSLGERPMRGHSTSSVSRRAEVSSSSIAREQPSRLGS